ncbi:hypothetical protein FB451DRAFT_1442342 [Mycena latifolia]|nr:hypothetical protein FB451DRAFT_1442342 [Mycena latifolia]
MPRPLPPVTLHKIHTLIEAEGEKSIIKQFFRQVEMRILLKACHMGLEQALQVFKASSQQLLALSFSTRAFQIQGVTVLSNVADMQQHAQRKHQEVLELISALSEEGSDSGSLISRVSSSSHNSSNSLSLLPSEPKIFHGHELEVSVIMQQLNQEIPRIAILGGGGMGKTSLARAILHHPQISAKYQQYRFFIACDAASSSVQLAALMGAHVGLQPGPDLTEPVVQYFLNSGPSLLDNLETVWEPRECRADVEKLLALLEDIQHLALIITMRGAERPAKVQWTRPFLEPLKPLSQQAARKTFVDIVDDGYAVEDIDKILLHTDNMPLAIDLIAHLVDYDGFDSVMHQWETEHFNHLLKVYSTYHGTVSSPAIVARIAFNLTNIRNVLISGLKQDNPDLSTTIECACQFERFMGQTGRGQAQLIHQIPDILPTRRDYRLEVSLIITHLLGYEHNPVPNAEDLVTLAIDNLPQFDDPDLKCLSYMNLYEYSARSKGDLSRGIHFAQCGLSLSISTGNTKGQADSLTTLAWIKFTTGDYSGSREDAYESRRLARILGNLFMEARALHFESICWYALGNYNHAILLANRARDLLGVCAMSGGELDSSILINQAEVHMLKSEYAEAQCAITQTLPTFSKRNPYDYAYALLRMAQIDAEIGALRNGAQSNLDSVKQLFSHMGYPLGIITCNIFTAGIDVNEGDLLNATGLFQTCLESAWGKSAENVSYCLEKLGNASLWHTLDHHTSSNWTMIFMVHSLKLKQKLGIHKALQYLGDVYLADGDHQTAFSLFTVALEGFTNMDVHRSRAECMLRIGDIMELHGDLRQAAELWTTARPLFERSSQAKQVGHIDERLARTSNQLQNHPEPMVQHLQLLAFNALSICPDTVDVGEDEIKPALIPA